MSEFLKNDNLGVFEEDLWEYLVKWANYQSNNKINQSLDNGMKYADTTNNYNNYKLELLKAVRDLVRFGLMDGNYFATKIVPENIVTNAELIAILLYFQNPTAGCGTFNVSPRKYPMKYTLRMSTEHPGPSNTYDALVSDNIHEGCGTDGYPNDWIEARFESLNQITAMEIGPPGTSMCGKWSRSQFNRKILQYEDATGHWKNIQTLSGFKNNETKILKVDITAAALRVKGSGPNISKKHYYVGIGKWRIFGYIYFNKYFQNKQMLKT